MVLADLKKMLNLVGVIDIHCSLVIVPKKQYNAWQHKAVIDYVTEGGENTYASYGDSWILNKKSITIIY